MGLITPPNTFVDGAVAAPADFAENLYNPTVPGSSFAERNGLLDQDNFAQALGHRCFKLGAGALGGTIRTARPWDMCREYEDKPPNKQTFKPVPGAGIRFWAPWKCAVFFSWTLVYRGDFEYNSPQLVIPDYLFKFYVNGAAQNPERHMNSAWDGQAFPNATADYGQRIWTGFWQTDAGVSFTAEQWHAVGVRLRCDYPVASDTFKHTYLRVYRAVFSYLLLKLD